MNNLGNMVYITGSSLGVFFEKQEETTEQLTMWISVPEHSQLVNRTNKEMAGIYLAKWLEGLMSALGVKQLKLVTRIRTGETWTEDFANAAEINARKMVYNDQ